MNGIAGWILPTIAIALVLIAVSTTLLAAITVASVLVIRRQAITVSEQLLGLSSDAKAVARRMRIELTAYAALSAEARGKLKGAIATADRRLSDLDALVEVLQQEAEETALDVAAMVRAVRRPRSIFGILRAALSARRAAAAPEDEDEEEDLEDEDIEDIEDGEGDESGEVEHDEDGEDDEAER